MGEHRSSGLDHFDEEVRQHFWTDEEERHATEVIEGEGRVYTTVMHKFLMHLEQRVNESSIEEKRREMLGQLVSDVPKKIYAYIKSRIAFRRAAENIRAHGTIGQAGMKDADSRRRFAHEALLDSIAIATRNVVQSSPDAGTLPDEMRPIVDTMQGDYRNIVATAAIDYAWEFLDKEEWERGRKQPTN